MKQYLFLFLVSSLISLSSLEAQDLRISGKVVYASNGQAVPYAYVLVKGQARGTVSDYTGKFSLKVPESLKNASLVFSYMGLKNQELPISRIKDPLNLVVRLQADIMQLDAIQITQSKQLNPLKILKKAISQIKKNYAQDEIYLDTYCREVLKENGAFIQYADGVSRIFYGPYSGKSYRWKDFSKARKKVGSTYATGYLLSRTGRWGERLHDHFTGRSLVGSIATDLVEIIDSRSSDNLSQERMFAHLEGGPLAVSAKDLVRYLNFFMDKKSFKKYIYEIGEVPAEGDKWHYVISFEPRRAPSPDEVISKRLKENKRISRTDILSGQIYIDQDSYAITQMNYGVAPRFKKHICNLRKMQIQHFGYDVEVKFRQKGDRWYLDKIRKQDEFLFEDTVKQTVTPYQSIAELYIQDVISNDVKALQGETVYNAYSANDLFEEAVSYQEDFWKNYAENYPIAIIPDSIRKDMEKEKSLEKQFRDKHYRDENMLPPIAEKKPYNFSIHGQEFTDNYHWLKDTKNPKYNEAVRSHLDAENAYTKNHFVPLRKTQRDIFRKMMSRTIKDYESFPSKNEGVYYKSVYQGENEYPIILMNADTLHQPWDTLFNVNAMAQDKDYFSLAGYMVSPDRELVAYGVNTSGNDRVDVFFKEIESGKKLKDSLTNIGGLLWLRDNKSVYYTVQEPRTYRSYKIMKHTLGQAQSEDQLIYEEKDKEFSVNIYKSRKSRFFFIASESANSSEIRFRFSENSSDDFEIIHPRENNHQYQVYTYQDQFYILSNKKAPNYRVLTCPVDHYQFEAWEEVIPDQKNVLITNFLRLDNYMIIQEKKNASDFIKVIDLRSKKSHYIKFKEEVASCSVLSPEDTDTEKIRVAYSSFVVPTIIYEYDLANREKKVLKKNKVRGLGNKYLELAYKVKRVWATAKDGTKIPISLVYSKFNMDKDGADRLWLTAYGAYGSSYQVGFSQSVLNLLELGFVYAIAHVRGGRDCGQQWYEEGKLLNKKNTFTDFISCAEFLIDQKYTSSDRLVIQGGSAGGLLMGAVANMRPDLFHTIILDVPFVDVVNTMNDPGLPLTTLEYKEWGPPQVKKYFKYMQSYSPYDNIKAQNYPNMLFFTGINDTRVGYWEPAKMVAKLRDQKTDQNLTLLKTNFSAGHGGNSGRFANFKEMAFKLALVLDLLKKNPFAASDPSGN